jgi:hypothetical protein
MATILWLFSVEKIPLLFGICPKTTMPLLSSIICIRMCKTSNPQLLPKMIDQLLSYEKCDINI